MEAIEWLVVDRAGNSAAAYNQPTRLMMQLRYYLRLSQMPPRHGIGLARVTAWSF
jgi:hypothetical protein